MLTHNSFYHSLTLSPWLLLLSPPLLACSRSGVKTSQSLTCFSRAQGEGNILRATDYIEDLTRYNFDNQARSCCVTGVWVVYGREGYNKRYPTEPNWWVYGADYCTDVPRGFENKASSIRFVGAPDDWKYDTLNLYFENYFIGEEEFMYDDKSVLQHDNRAKSIIVTGCSGWTLYQYDNYQGYAICVYPSDISTCNPGFYSTSTKLGMMAGQVSSVRRGCYARDKIYPENNGVRAPHNNYNWIYKPRK